MVCNLKSAIDIATGLWCGTGVPVSAAPLSLLKQAQVYMNEGGGGVGGGRGGRDGLEVTNQAEHGCQVVAQISTVQTGTLHAE